LVKESTLRSSFLAGQSRRIGALTVLVAGVLVVTPSLVGKDATAEAASGVSAGKPSGMSRTAQEGRDKAYWINDKSGVHITYSPNAIRPCPPPPAGPPHCPPPPAVPPAGKPVPVGPTGQ
jgi:hypothetical protein